MHVATQNRKILKHRAARAAAERPQDAAEDAQGKEPVQEHRAARAAAERPQDAAESAQGKEPVQEQRAARAAAERPQDAAEQNKKRPAKKAGQRSGAERRFLIFTYWK